MKTNLARITGLATALSALALPVLAQSTEAVTEVVTDTMDKGDVAWMMVSTLLVLMMILPGLALFYGGLVRPRTCCRC